MPALVLFGRRWQIGSDDLVIPSFFDLLIRLSWLIGSIVIYWQDELHFECSGGYYIKFYFYGMFGIAHAVILLDALILQSSRSGSIMETEARKHVALFLYFRLLVALTSIGWNALGITWLFCDNFQCDQAPSSLSYIKCVITFNLIILVIQCLFLLYVYDPLGGYKNQFSPYDADDEFSVFSIELPILKTAYTKMWENRCKRYCCSCDASDETQDAFREIGKIFGTQLAEDLVSSDIVAGLLLLNLKDKQDRSALNSVDVFDDRVIVSEPSKKSFATFSCDFSEGEDWRSKKHLFQFVKYACAAYGWIFVPPKRLWNSCICCSCIPKRNYRYPQRVEGDNCCLCCTSGVKDLNKIEFDDIVHVTFRNKLFENPFFVAVDHKTRSVVISIRGTLSLHDVVMDMTGWPGHIPGYPSTFLGHHGMVKGAINLKKKLDNLDIIPKLLAEYQDYGLVVTGQSLGSGLATIVSLLLKLEYPNVRCYAYSPPGGLLSREAAEYCNDFLISVIYGDDMISRLGLLQFERLKFRLINVLKNCKVPKYRILLRGLLCCGGTPDSYLGSDSNFNTELPPGSIRQDIVGSRDTTNTAETAEESGSALNMETDCDKSTYSQAYPETRYPSVPGMYPPGVIFYITEVPSNERKHPKARWTWRWADRTEFDDIIVSNKMVWDHIPIKMPRCLRYLAKAES